MSKLRTGNNDLGSWYDSGVKRSRSRSQGHKVQKHWRWSSGRCEVCTHWVSSFYTASQKKTSPFFISRSLVKHCSILIIFRRNIPEKMQLDGVMLFLTSPNWCFCTTWGNNLKQKSQILSIFCYSTVSFVQSNVESANLVHRKYGASSDSA